MKGSVPFMSSDPAKHTADLQHSVVAASPGFLDSVPGFRSFLGAASVPEKPNVPAHTTVERILRSIDQQTAQHANLGGLLRSLDGGKPNLFSCFHRHMNSAVAAKALTLKVLNLCLTKYHFLRRSGTLLSKPFGLLVDPCNSCHLACPGCVHSQRARALNLFQWKPGMAAPSRVGEFLSRYGPTGIQTLFCNYGEPLLNPDTPKFIRRAKGYLLPTWLSTSLSVPRFDAEAYVASGLDYMVLSIDGATQATYEKYRRHGDLQLVFRNLRSLVDAKTRSGRKTPLICWQYLAFEHNVHEIALAIDLARDLGVDLFKVSRAFDVSWDDPDTRTANVPPSIQEFGAKSEIDNLSPFYDELDSEAIEREFDAHWIDKLPQGYVERDGPPEGRRVHTCHWLYKDIIMDAHGRILPCAGAPTQDGSLLFSHLEAGSRNAGGPDELFNSEKYLRARQFFAAPSAYARKGGSESANDDPHCVNCDWFKNQTKPDIGNQHADQYLAGIGPDLFSEASRRILCAW
jgi:MoaA/NifB/PqqE/SkfB family radical SAM enzyme